MNGDSPDFPMELLMVPLHVMSTHRDMHTPHIKMAHTGNIVRNAKVEV